MKLNCVWWWGSDLGVQGMWSTPALSLHSGPLWLGKVLPIRFTSIDQTEQFKYLKRVIIIRYLKWYSCVQVIRIWWEYVMNRITKVKSQYLKPLICVPKKDKVELSVLGSNT